jgi:ribonuclease HII
VPDLSLENDLLRSSLTVGGVDEVGRGALAGPVAVGVVVVDAATGEPPRGLNDSKLMTRRNREAIVEPIHAWAVAGAVGMATAVEIDEVGIVAAMGLAYARAFEALSVKPDALILDGKHDWVSSSGAGIPVTMKVKADTTCASVSAASVLAKVARDGLMRDLAALHPEFGWEGNVGYGSAGHMDAIRALGPTEYHRRSWALPTREPQAPIG